MAIITADKIPDSSLADQEMLRYARQILLAGWDIDAQLRLKNSHVLIVGMGGLGCPLAETLVRAGVGHVTLIDFDTIDESNIQRQSLFLPKDSGQLKVMVAKQRLTAINEFCQIDAITNKLTDDNSIELLTNFLQNSLSKLICDCTDNYQTRDHINQIAVKQNLPLLSASAIAQTGQMALFEPQQGCYHCIFPNDNNNQQVQRTCMDTGVLASTTQIMGNLQAQVALTYLGLGKNPIKQQLLLWQGESMALKKLAFQRDPTCLSCGDKT